MEPQSDNQHIVIDTNGTPLGAVVVPEAKTIQDVDLDKDIVPLGASKVNPKTGEAGNDNDLLVVTAFSALTLEFLRNCFRNYSASRN